MTGNAQGPKSDVAGHDLGLGRRGVDLALTVDTGRGNGLDHMTDRVIRDDQDLEIGHGGDLPLDMRGGY